MYHKSQMQDFAKIQNPFTATVLSVKGNTVTFDSENGVFDEVVPFSSLNEFTVHAKFNVIGRYGRAIESCGFIYD